jgi:hypothetical protein
MANSARGWQSILSTPFTVWKITVAASIYLGAVVPVLAQNCTTPPGGLVGWWTGDGTANTFVGTNNGTLQGGATATGVGMVAQAFSLNGTTAYVQIPDSTLLRPTNLTVEAWVLFTSLNSTGNAPAGQQFIVFKQNTRNRSSEGYYLGKERPAGKDVFAFAVTAANGKTANVYSTNAITTNVWYHVAGLRGSNSVQIYVNGQLHSQAVVNFAQNYGNFPLYFGTSGQSSLDGKLAGLLDEVSLYNRALSASEIAAIYNAGSAGKCKVATAPGITTPPESQTVAVGSNVLFTVVASGTTPLSYQWQLTGAPIANATRTSFAVNNVQTTDSGSYSVVVTNSAGSITSAVAVLTVLTPPAITSPPQSLTVVSGDTANFSATATGSAPLTYQWKLNGNNLANGTRISGATSTALSITSVQASDAGNYTLTVSNAVGFVTSAPAVLTVNGPPSVTTPPSSQNVIVGSNATFTVVATGTAPLSYQWQFNGGAIAGATTTSFTVTSAQPANQGNYAVVVTNVAGSVTSAVAVLTVLVPPSVTTQPVNQTNPVGSTASFTLTASGTSPLGYQWRLNGANLANGARISGATSSAVTITGVQTADAGNYTGVVTNSAGSVTSAIATLTVIVPPSIAGPPSSQTVATGSNVSFTVTAAGTAPLSYQWLYNGSALSNGGQVSGATTSALALGNVQPSNGGGYSVLVTNLGGSITSAVAVLTVLTPPSISSPPQDLTVVSGNTANFSATASGSTPLTYQWKLNGNNLVNGARISGATSSGLSITSVQASDAGNYTITVSNAVGSVTSAPAALTVNGPPVVTTPPSSQNVIVGSNATFTVAATGTAPLSYQWQFNGGAIAGATTTSYAVTGAQSANQGNYTVVVTNVAGAVTSAVAVLTVLVPPSITTQPVNQTNPVGSTASFALTASGTSPLGYQWRLNGANLANGSRISGATSSAVTITGIQTADAGNYTAVVTNSAGSLTSAIATLTVIVPPSVTSPPSSQTVATGSNVSFTVTAAGTAPLSYQWLFNGTALSNGGQVSGATTSALALSNVQTSNGGGYSVLVTNLAGSITSSVATLTVTAPGSCVPPPANLVGWWTGDGSAADYLGADNGTLQGGATATSAGKVAQCFSFDGVAGYVQIPNAPALNPATFTVEFWVLFTSLDSPASGNSPAGEQYLVFKQNTRTGDFEGIYVGKERGPGGDIFVTTVTSAAGVPAEVDSTNSIIIGTWYHVAAARGSNYLQLYVNGQLIGQTNVSFPQDYGTLPLYFGTSGQSYWDHKLAGKLDEVALYNRALSGAEIGAIYAAGSSGKCKAPSAPVILSQPAGQMLVLGGTATFAVTATGTAPLSYRWIKDGFALSDDGRIVGSSNSVLTISSLQSSDVGNYQVIISNAIGSVTSAVAALSPGSPPANDNFASPQSITGSSGSFSGNNFNATKETGEPNHAGNGGGASVWFTWTALSTSPVTFDTALSGFDTLLAVYTGSSLSSLTPIASNNDMNANSSRSRLTFTPVSGTTYRIALDGNNAATGNYTLRWVQASTPLPDLSIVASAVNPQITTETFASSSCAVLEGLIQAGTRTLIRFDTQTENSGTANLFFGDPANNPLFVWAPCHAHYHFNNYMSYRLRDANGRIAAVGLKVGFCVLDVFRWSSSAPKNALYTCSNQGIQTGWGDLYDSTLDGQWIDITGLPAGNYTMELEANPEGIIQEGNYSNNIATVPIAIGNPSAPPANDNFASAQALLGGFTSITGNNQNATKQAGEPNHAGNAGGHSLWYQWTAPNTQPVTIDTIGSSFNTLLAVYTGSSLTALTPVVSNDDIGPPTNLQSQVTFNATSGVVYDIAVDGFNGATGSVVLTLNQTIQNDNFAFLTFIGGVGGSVRGSNLGATKETGEPNHAGNPGGASIWYGWTAPISGIATFDTLGSSFNTLLGVYTGSSVDSLTLVANNDDIGPPTNLQSKVTFNAVGLTRYNIAIDGFNGAMGDSVLNWSLAAGPNIALVTRPAESTLPPWLASGAPVILGHRFLSEGEFQLIIQGPAVQLYLIEVSSDLIHWRPLVTTVADNLGQAYFTDKSSHSHNRAAVNDPLCGPDPVVGFTTTSRTGRFYRAKPIGARLYQQVF